MNGNGSNLSNPQSLSHNFDFSSTALDLNIANFLKLRWSRKTAKMRGSADKLTRLFPKALGKAVQSAVFATVLGLSSLASDGMAVRDMGVQDERTVELLREHRQRVDARRDDMGEYWIDRDAVFPHESGDWMHTGNITRNIARLGKRVGCPGVTAHLPCWQGIAAVAFADAMDGDDSDGSEEAA